MQGTLPKPDSKQWSFRQRLIIFVKGVILSTIIISITWGIYYYIADTPHCHFSYDANNSYSCDMFASKTEKQNICIQDSLMNMQGQGITGYNADTGKSYILSETEQQNLYNFIVESCK